MTEENNKGGGDDGNGEQNATMPLPTGDVEKLLDRLEQSMQQWIGKVESMFGPRPRSRRKSTSPGCWRCGARDHFRRDCPKQKQAVGKRTNVSSSGGQANEETGNGK